MSDPTPTNGDYIIADAHKVIAVMRARLSRQEMSEAMRVFSSVRKNNTRDETALIPHALELLMIVEHNADVLRAVQGFMDRHMDLLGNISPL
tara:strand:+ start:246 stop:521 length:276 start_codon:yes stop_codon:yes gene_type:complete